MPRFAFDFVDGGAESEDGLARNSSDFQKVQLTPRYLRDVSQVDTSVELFGKTYRFPFGIAPVGFMNMIWPGADLMLARLAGRHQIPHTISTASSTSIEEMAAAADGNAWFQAYPTHDETIMKSLIGRAKAAGIDVLVVTVDVPQPGKRDRDVRNGLRIPFRLTPSIMLDLARHPQWALGTLANGPPGFGNFADAQKSAQGSTSLIEIQEKIISRGILWSDIRALRDQWQGAMLIKGLMHPADAREAVRCGCDGIIVSNHGGRQADYSPSSISVLADMVSAVGADMAVLIDSGIRRGSDVVRAKALGASMALAGRAFAYGAGAGGEHGCARAFEILETELTCAIGQLGCARFSDIDESFLAATHNLRQGQHGRF